MAKAGIKLDFTAYSRRDPVSGATKTFLRNGHTRTSSPTVLRQRSCVASGMRGFHATGATPADRSRSLRNQFATVSKRCASGG